MKHPSLLLVVAAACAAITGMPAAAASRCDVRSTRPSTTDSGCADEWFDHHLRLNDLLVVGSHNSYKQRIPSTELALIAESDAVQARELDYAHPSLTAELDTGARQLEIDVHHDPDGGRYRDPLVPRIAGADLGEAWKAAMAKPGFKTFHVPDVDVRSSCFAFRTCLAEIRAWSDAHPRHVPIILLVNAKEGAGFPGGVASPAFDAAAFDALDAEIRAELGAKLITPDSVQGHYPTLRDAVLHGNWPTLGDARGRVLIALDEDPRKVAIYRGERKSLEGRVMFVNAPDEQSPVAAYFTLNDPVQQAGRIRRDVALGFLVRTRADSGTHEARDNNPVPRDAALAGGAQVVSTDYLWPDARFAGGYRVNLPGAAAVCNPVRMKRCAGVPVEPR
jgi:hypothetical protein